LLALGTWIFGALIAFNLLILAALLTVGPVDLLDQKCRRVARLACLLRVGRIFGLTVG
jgi:hypothetical protein